MRTLTKSKLILLATTAMLVSAAPVIASAQTETDGKLDTVIVTARKQSEDVLKVPVAITAFTGADLVARDIKTPSDLSNFTPSLTDNVSTSGGARVDRSTETFVIRGLTPSNKYNPTTSIFLNGVPVGAADFLQNLDDIDHVEVLKGPQSAYFGRETFAGAINAVAKPAGNTLTGDFIGELGTRDTYNFSGSVTIPIIPDVLSVRAGLYYDAHDGSYKNPDVPGQTLGDQETRSAHIAVTFRPIQNLTIKAFGMAFRDADGPEATGLLLANGPAAFNQSNCTVANTAFFCGTLPGLKSGVSPAENTVVTAGEAAFFNNPGGLIPADQVIHKFGLRRDAYHGDINVQYDIPNWGLTLTYLGGFNHDNYSSVSDLSNIDGTATGQYPGYTGFPFLVEYKNHDYSDEFRIATDQTKRLRATIGASYLDVYSNNINASLSGTPAPAAFGSATVSKTAGVFFGLAFDILPPLTLSFDGRYQRDREQSLTPASLVSVEGTSTNFLPRVSLQYKVIPNVMVYATYSEGVNPGVFNAAFNSLPTASQQEVSKSGSAGALVVKPEDITNYELGVKGRFLDGRATLSADVYYDDWTNQISPNVYLFAANDPANPYNVVGSSFYAPGTGQYQYLSSSNSGSTHAKGFEVEANLIPIEHLTINLVGSINDTKYSSGICGSCAPYATSGLTAPSVAGKYLPFSPEYSAAVGVEYARSTTFLKATDWFARVDYIYRDGVYIQPDNTAKTPDSNVVNLRGGINWGRISFEGYVNNLFNDKAYTTGFENSNFAGGFAPAVMVGLPQLITGGIRARYHF
jgi:iron complex outermembrane receptor protein